MARKVYGDSRVIWNMDDSLEPCSSAVASRTASKNVETKTVVNEKAQLDEPILEIEEFTVKTWPVPSNNNFNVRVYTSSISDVVSINVYDINGRLVHNGEFNSDTEYSFGGNLQPGIYVMKITQDSNIKTKRLIKK